MPHGRRIVYYALGGGHGHALRGLAILGHLRRLDPTLSCLLLIPERLEAWAQLENVPAACPPGVPTRDELAGWSAEQIGSEANIQLVVDVFPRGVLGELPGSLGRLARPAWLVARRVRPSYYSNPEVRWEIENRYGGIVWCEEPPDELRTLRVPQERVSPVTIRDADECLERSAARRTLGLPLEARVILVLGSGDGERQRDLLRLLRKIRLRLSARTPIATLFLSDLLPASGDEDVSIQPLFPAMRYLRAADVVIAAGGYSAVHEAETLGVPAIHIPQARRYDDQSWRVHSRVVAGDPERLEATLRRLLEADVRSPRVSVSPAVNGAAEIAGWLAGGSAFPPQRGRP